MAGWRIYVKITSRRPLPADFHLVSGGVVRCAWCAIKAAYYGAPSSGVGAPLLQGSNRCRFGGVETDQCRFEMCIEVQKT